METPGESTISDRDFKAFAELLHREAGIHLPDHKKPLLQSRLNKLLRQRGIATYREYYDKIIADSTRDELTGFINLLSTNVTHFFREIKHFEFMRDVWWPELQHQGHAPEIWSAACSSGEEPYSLAIHMEELSDGKIPYSILASDISTRMLTFAGRGIYPVDRLSGLPDNMKRRYFQRGKNRAEGFLRVRPELQQHVRFLQLNLMEPIPFRRDFDLILCRNVMIYFQPRDKEAVVQRLSRCLRPGGYLFIGHSESLNGLDHPLHYIAPAIYRKPDHA